MQRTDPTPPQGARREGHAPAAPTPRIPGVSDTTIESCAEDYRAAEPTREHMFDTWRNRRTR